MRDVWGTRASEAMEFHTPAYCTERKERGIRRVCHQGGTTPVNGTPEKALWTWLLGYNPNAFVVHCRCSVTGCHNAETDDAGHFKRVHGSCSFYGWLDLVLRYGWVALVFEKVERTSSQRVLYVAISDDSGHDFRNRLLFCASKIWSPVGSVAADGRASNYGRAPAR